MDFVAEYFMSFYPEPLLDELWEIPIIVAISDDEECLSLTFLQEGYDNGIKEAWRIFFKWRHNHELFEYFAKAQFESVTEVGELIYD